eukprot:gene3410-3737_t
MALSNSTASRRLTEKTLFDVFVLDGVRRHLLTYLWIPSLLQLRACGHHVKEVIMEDSALMLDLLNILLSRRHSHVDGVTLHALLEDKNKQSVSFWEVVIMGSRLTTWPSRMVARERSKSLRESQQQEKDKMEEEEEGQEEEPDYAVYAMGAEELSNIVTSQKIEEDCYSYYGPLDGSSRSLVADDHWPVIGSVKPAPSTRPATVLPFSKVSLLPAASASSSLATSTNCISSLAEKERGGSRGKHWLHPSCVSYFEVTIHATKRSLEADEARLSRRVGHRSMVGRNRDEEEEGDDTPCVCVGMALSNFDYSENMPGWDEWSVGFHGDDGMLFDGWEHTHSEFGAKFGAGDTVGFGLLHSLSPGQLNSGLAGPLCSPRESGQGSVVFLTINGELRASFLLRRPCTPMREAWFPVIGLDCYWAIEVNLGSGKKPFLFDVNHFEKVMPLSALPARIFRHITEKRQIKRVIVQLRQQLLAFETRMGFFCDLLNGNDSSGIPRESQQTISQGKDENEQIIPQESAPSHPSLLPHHIFPFFRSPEMPSCRWPYPPKKQRLIDNVYLTHLVLLEDVLGRDIYIEERYCKFLVDHNPGDGSREHITLEHQRFFGDFLSFIEDEDGDEIEEVEGDEG